MLVSEKGARNTQTTLAKADNTKGCRIRRLTKGHNTAIVLLRSTLSQLRPHAAPLHCPGPLPLTGTQSVLIDPDAHRRTHRTRHQVIEEAGPGLGQGRSLPQNRLARRDMVWYANKCSLPTPSTRMLFKCSLGLDQIWQTSKCCGVLLGQYRRCRQYASVGDTSDRGPVSAQQALHVYC